MPGDGRRVQKLAVRFAFASMTSVEFLLKTPVAEMFELIEDWDKAAGENGGKR